MEILNVSLIRSCLSILFSILLNMVDSMEVKIQIKMKAVFQQEIIDPTGTETRQNLSRMF